MEDLKIDDESAANMSAGSIQAMLMARETGLLGKPGIKMPRNSVKSVPTVPEPIATSSETESQEEVVADDSRSPGGAQPYVCFGSGSLNEVNVTAEVTEERFLNRLNCLTDTDAEDNLERIECQLGGRQTRSTFLVVFSPDRELMASTHGDHNIYVTKTSNGKCVNTLKGHPRTPWCVAFHPTHHGLLASGCLAGHVRIWDLYGDGSELWRANNVIASLTFHPVMRLLVIATVNTLVFWDWRFDKPFGKASTATEKEEIRYVKFDSLGHQLITGIANLSGRDTAASRTGPGRFYQRRVIEPTAADMGMDRRYNNRPLGIDPDMTYGRYRSLARRELPPDNDAPEYVPRRRQERDRWGLGPDSQSMAPASRASSSSPSASRTLSDLAAAASHRLMAENAAEMEEAMSALRQVQRQAQLRQAQRQTQQRPSPAARPNFSHSPESSFVEVFAPSRYSSPNGTNRTEVYSSSRSSRFDAQERFRQLCERRRGRLLQRRLATGTDILPHTEDGGIDDWARILRNRSDNASFATPAAPPAPAPTAPEPEDEDEELEDELIAPAVAQYSDYTRALPRLLSPPEGRHFRNQTPRSMTQTTVETSTNTETPTPEQPATAAAADAPTLEASASSSASTDATVDLTHNDHTYSTSTDNSTTSTTPGQSSQTSLQPASGPMAEEERNTDSSLGQRQNSDLVLLSRHILHMQRICRASMADCSVSRHRRQIVRLQSIRRMLEDLQRQIRSLRNASFAELSRRSREAESLGSALGDFRHRNRRRARDAEAPNILQSLRSESNFGLPSPPSDATGRPPMMDEATSLRHLGIRARNPVLARATRRPVRAANGRGVGPSSPRATLTTNPLSGRRVVPPRIHRMSRAHNQLVEQMRASFRATHQPQPPELSPIANDDEEVSRKDDHPNLDSPSLGCVFKDGVLKERKSKSGVGKRSPNFASKGAQSLDFLKQKLDLLVKGVNDAKNKKKPTRILSKDACSSRSELRALSQRLERMVRSDRKDEEQRVAAETTDPSQGFSKRLNDTLERFRSDRRPGRLATRYRHLMDGIDGPFPDDPMPEPNLERRNPTVTMGGAVSSLSNSDSDNDESARRMFGDVDRPLSPSQRIQRLRFPPSLSRSRYHLSRQMASDRILSARTSVRESLINDIYRTREDGSVHLIGQDEGNDQPQRISDNLLSNVRSYADPHLNVELPPSSDEHLPLLQELIWRRLRRQRLQRTDFQRMEDEATSAGNVVAGTAAAGTTAAGPGGSGARYRNREFLSWMVDQMRIDQARENVAAAGVGQVPRNDESVGGGRGIGSPNQQFPGPNAPNNVRGVFELDRERIDRERQRAEVERDRFYMFAPQAQSNMLLTHRIQAWDFSNYKVLDLRNANTNLVVKEARIHNDASVDISEDGSILVTLVPSNLPMTTVVGIFGLKPPSEFGRCFATCNLESSAVSVSLSPTSRHLVVGLTIRTATRIAMAMGDRSLMAQVFRIVLPQSKETRGRLDLRRNIHMTQQAQIPSLNCVKWIPIPGQGIVYATNTGLLKILR